MFGTSNEDKINNDMASKEMALQSFLNYFKFNNEEMHATRQKLSKLICG